MGFLTSFKSPEAILCGQPHRGAVKVVTESGACWAHVSPAPEPLGSWLHCPNTPRLPEQGQPNPKLTTDPYMFFRLAYHWSNWGWTGDKVTSWYGCWTQPVSAKKHWDIAASMGPYWFENIFPLNYCNWSIKVSSFLNSSNVQNTELRLIPNSHSCPQVVEFQSICWKL